MTRPYNLIRVNGFVVPATRHDAIKKILHDLSTGRIGTRAHGRYRSARVTPTISTCVCAIGTFFTDEQLDQIVNARYNRLDVHGLAHAIGPENFEAMTGLEIGVARVIQSDFDFLSNRAYSLFSFGDRMRDILKNERNAPNPAAVTSGEWHWPVSVPA
jgi:hypothetical protein